MAHSSAHIDSYIGSLFADRHNQSLYSDILAAAHEAGLPQISISASQGQFLHLLVRLTGATRILEIGSLGGYSGTWLASALPEGGEMVTLEIDAKHAEVATANFQRAGLASKTKVLVGPASDTLDNLIAQNAPLFDIVFIDADKPSYTTYLDKALSLVRKGGLILGDNTLSHGVLDGDTTSGIAAFNQAIAGHARLTSAIIPVMKHDVDGLSISLVG